LYNIKQKAPPANSTKPKPPPSEALPNPKAPLCKGSSRAAGEGLSFYLFAGIINRKLT